MAQEPSTKRARTDAAAAVATENGSGAVENPYLAHLNESAQRPGSMPVNGKAPFDGWMPRKSSGAQVEQAMVSTLFSRFPLASLHAMQRCASHGSHALVKSEDPRRVLTFSMVRTHRPETSTRSTCGHTRKSTTTSSRSAKSCRFTSR